MGFTYFICYRFIKKKNEVRSDDVCFTIDTTTQLRGLAIIFLILGHLAIKCIDGVMAWELAAKWAVVIFLFVSGVGVVKAYGLENLGKRFVRNRIRRLVFPVWLTLSLFYCLDYLLLNRTYSTVKVTLSFLGVIKPGPPNGPAWFITYIMFLYMVYYLASVLKIGVFKKFCVILFSSYISTYCIVYVPFLEKYFPFWQSYAAVFPVAILIGLYRSRLYSFLSKLFGYSSILFMACMLGLAFLYFINADGAFVSKIRDIPFSLKVFFETMLPIFFIVAIVMFAYLLDVVGVRSGVLTFLGKYSFEIYLLHLPFMENYDFFMFRKPLFLYFYSYIGFVLVLSYLLNKFVASLNRSVFLGNFPHPVSPRRSHFLSRKSISPAFLLPQLLLGMQICFFVPELLYTLEETSSKFVQARRVW